MEPKIFELRCSVCGTKTGEYTLPESFTGNVEDLTLADIGVADTRCDEHPPEKAEVQAPITVEIETPADTP